MGLYVAHISYKLHSLSSAKGLPVEYLDGPHQDVENMRFDMCTLVPFAYVKIVIYSGLLVDYSGFIVEMVI